MSASSSPPVPPVPEIHFPPFLLSLDSSITSVDSFENYLQNHTEFALEENRPWSRGLHRTGSGCIGRDFFYEHKSFTLHYYWSPALSLLCGSIQFTNKCEGPPTGCHGASIASVFDEILAYPIWRSDRAAFTAQLNVNFREMIPLASKQAFFARIREIQGRKAFVEGSIFNFSPPSKHHPTVNGRVYHVFSDSLSVWIISNKINPVGVSKIIQREKSWNETQENEHEKGIYGYGKRTNLKGIQEVLTSNIPAKL
jgi:hypothetical protein